MNIPRKVKIGGHTYKVVFQKETGLSNNVCGRTNRENGIIAIDSGLIQSEKEVTFFHEAIHVMNSEYKEHEVDFLAQAFYGFLKENKLLK